MKRALVFLTALLAFASCGKFEGTPDGFIKVHVRKVATKGSVVTTDNLDKFVMDCWADADYHDENGVDITDHHYIDGALVTKSSSTWSMNADYFWINGVDMHFWSYSPETKEAITITDQKEGQDNMSFTYSDSDASTDLILAYNEECCEYNSFGFLSSGSETLQIEFKHALAQVRFAVCTSDLSFDKDQYEIVSMSLGCLANGGSCVFNGSSSTFTWTPTGTSGSYTQSLNADLSSSAPDSWTEETSNGKTYYIHSEDVLFVIPQTTYSTSYASLTLKRKSDSSTFTKTAYINGEVWEAGKYYTYLIKYTDVHFDITLLHDDYDPYKFD